MLAIGSVNSAEIQKRSEINTTIDWACSPMYSEVRCLKLGNDSGQCERERNYVTVPRVRRS
jgi:hypothetical protein